MRFPRSARICHTPTYSEDVFQHVCEATILITTLAFEIPNSLGQRDFEHLAGKD